MIKIISGGQTGVDTAAIEAALTLGYPYGGWVPNGRTNESKAGIPETYANLRETKSTGVLERTRLNVEDADVLLVITRGNASSGTNAALAHANKCNKPTLVVDLEASADHLTRVRYIANFLIANKAKSVNVAGPRNSEAPDIATEVKHILEAALPLATVDRNEALANMRHWDNIRWIVPFWYLSASGASLAFIPKNSAINPAWICIAMFCVGLACMRLVHNTGRYHDLERGRLLAVSRKEDLGPLAAISFEEKSNIFTATYVFQALQYIVIASWGVGVFIAIGRPQKDPLDCLVDFIRIHMIL